LVWVDPMRLSQVFDNLLGNAIKFSPRGSVVIVSLRDDGEESVQTSVQDQGIGIEAAHLDHIWERFFRVDSQFQYEGTGLGLAIVKDIIEMHQGKVWVESEPGKGSSFHFTVPQTSIEEVKRFKESLKL
jgi:signal transduction histidine kinase